MLYQKKISNERKQNAKIIRKNKNKFMLRFKFSKQLDKYNNSESNRGKAV